MPLQPPLPYPQFPLAAPGPAAFEPAASAPADPGARAARVAAPAAPPLPDPPHSEPPPQALFDHWPDAILRFDARLRVVFANVALERATALPRAAFLGHRLDDVAQFAPYAPLWNGRVGEVLATLQARSFKFIYSHPMGTKRFDVTLMLERQGGAGAFVTAMLRDATVPRSAIHTARTADAYLSTMMATAQIGMAILDRSLRYVHCNAHLALLLGTADRRLVGHRLDEVLDLSDAPQVMAGLERIRAGELRTTQQVEFRVPAGGPGGEPPWVRERRTPLFDSRGGFDGVFVTVEPIDAARFAETSLNALRQALDSAGEMVFEIRRDTTVVDANETALAWLGYTRDQIKGLALAALDVSLTPHRQQQMTAALDGDGSFHGEARYRTRGGAEFPVDVVLQRVVQGGREFVFLLVRDLTDRMRIEDELARYAQRLDTIFDESPVGMMLLDADLRIRRTNRAAANLVGTGEGELVGRTIDAVVHPDDAGLPARLRASLAAGQVAVDVPDRRLRHRDGRTVWVKVSARLLTANAGGRDVLLVLENFTERKIFEEQLQVALRDQQTLLETMSVGVAQALDGKILLANREFAQMFGYDDTEVVGMPLWDLCRDAAGRHPHEVSGLPVVRPLQTTSAEVVLYRKDGEQRWCLVQARAIERPAPLDAPAAVGGGGGASGEAIYTFQDISESKRQRETLARSLLELNVVIDATEVAVLHLDEAGRIQRGNAPAFAVLAGQAGAGAGAHGALLGRTLSSLFADAADYDTQRERMLPHLATGKPWSFETRLLGRAADGDGMTPFWAWVTVRAVDAQLRGMIVSILNVSERRRHEEQVHRLLAESQLIFDTALVGLLFVRDGRPVRANAAMEELLGCEPGALVGPLAPFTHPIDQMLAASLARHYADIDEEGTCEFELHMPRRRGEPIWVAVQGRAVDADQTELGYIFAFVDIDERKRSERELRATLNELQLIFDNALVSMIYVAEDLVVKANVATEGMFGLPARDLRELQVSSLFAVPQEWGEVLAELAEPLPLPPLPPALAVHPAGGAAVAANVREVAFERQMRRPGGTTFWAAGSARPIDPAVPERGLILVLLDVDQRRRSEDELRQVRNYLDLVVENLPVLVAVRDATSGRFTSINRAGEQITGVPREQVIGRTWHELLGRRFADQYAEMDRQAIATGQQVERPRDLWMRADGQALTVNQRVVPLFEGVVADDGSLRAAARYVMSIVDDQTGEAQAEAALQETETRFRQFAENIDQVVFIATADLTVVLFVNARYATLVGAPPAEVQLDPRNALAHVHPDDAARIAHELPRVISQLRRLRKAELALRIVQPAGGVRQVTVRLNPVRMHDGTVRVFGIADDVTERAAAERERLEEAVKQRDILVREVHHRIKNNLQGVAGLLQHMAHAKPEVEATLNEIAGQIQAIAQVHGLQIRATGTLPVLGVVQGIFQTLGAMFGATVRLETPPPALWRWGLPENEAVPLALVVNELGTNAIKHRGSRESALVVRVEPRVDGVAIQIENAGRLPAGFDLARIASGMSGLGLVKSLLPRRGARLSIEQAGTLVRTRLELSPPAIREDQGEREGP